MVLEEMIGKLIFTGYIAAMIFLVASSILLAIGYDRIALACFVIFALSGISMFTLIVIDVWRS